MVAALLMCFMIQLPEAMGLKVRDRNNDNKNAQSFPFSQTAVYLYF